jgi:acetyl-CoA acetyltransferase family protein
MGKAIILGAVRTPLGRRGGMLGSVHPVELLARVLSALVNRCGVPRSQVEDIIAGCVTQTGEQGANIARLSALLAGFPVHVPAVSINRMCGSSQQAVHFAAQAIEAGDMDLVIAAGVESMSRVPLGSDYGEFHPALIDKYGLVHQGISGEMMAEQWSITRDEMDRFSLDSHRKAGVAAQKGFFREEIVPVKVPGEGGGEITIDQDEGIRFDTSLEKLSSLKPAFKGDGVITAGNSSQITDGAAAVLLCSERKAKEMGLQGKARVLHKVVVGSDPVLMLDGPIPATRKILEKSGFSLNDFDVVEINEAFASVVLAWAKVIEPHMDRVNPHGGAIALGHPVGASGARIMATLLGCLEQRGGTLGFQTMCIGHGMATATIIERI